MGMYVTGWRLKVFRLSLLAMLVVGAITFWHHAQSVEALRVPTHSTNLCMPAEPYSPPASLALERPGLQQVIDPASTYTVYGYTAEQATSQIAHCTPVRSSGGVKGNFAADTAYALNWQFNYVGSGGLCKLSDIRVGLHISQVFPSWQPEGNGNNVLASRWQKYIARLHAYETGHVQLDEASGAAVLADLQNLPPTDCNDIAKLANDKANADIHAYDLANANYDLSREFGAKQHLAL